MLPDDSVSPPPQFHLSYSDKELLEREDRGESQQEILRRIAKDLPIYTRTMSGGTALSTSLCEPVRLSDCKLAPCPRDGGDHVGLWLTSTNPSVA